MLVGLRVALVALSTKRHAVSLVVLDFWLRSSALATFRFPDLRVTRSWIHCGPPLAGVHGHALQQHAEVQVVAAGETVMPVRPAPVTAHTSPGLTVKVDKCA